MLKITNSCEIVDLINEVASKSGKSYDEVETAFFAIGKYPEGRKTFLTTTFGPVLLTPEYEWLKEALQAIFTELEIDRLYVTEEI